MNNGKRIDRFNSKKIRKQVLADGDLQSLLQAGLLTFDFDGEIKVVASSNPGWLLIDAPDGDEGNEFSTWEFVTSPPPPAASIVIPVYTTGNQLGEGIEVWSNIQLNNPLETATYIYTPNNSTIQFEVQVVDGVIIQYSEKEEKK
jgi:hypothetical protein